MPKYGQIDGMPIGLNPNEVTIANLLKIRGYNTGIIGKWHLDNRPEFLPNRYGFYDFFSLPYSNDIHLPYKKYWKFPPLPLLRNEQLIETELNQDLLTQRYISESIQFRDLETRI